MAKPRYERLQKISSWRKLAVGMWGGAHNSPQAQGLREVDLTKTYAFIEKKREESGERVSLTHVFAGCMGAMFRKYPEYNLILRRNRPFKRESADLFLQVAVTGGGREDLSGVKIKHIDQLGVAEICAQLRERAEKVRAGKDKDIESAKKGLDFIPPFAMPYFLKAVTALSYDYGVDLSFLGVKPDPFGSAMVTNVGSFGIPHALVPLLPTSRVPFLFCLGAVHDRPMVVDGEVKVRPCMLVTGSFDHRLYDGYQIAKITHAACGAMADPEAYGVY